MPRKKIAGFTLIELMVSIAIMGILAAIVTANFTNSRARTRDLERQSDLRELQSAIENYKRDNGQYPEGCSGPDAWSFETACPTNYIKDLSPKYIVRLPIDPSNVSGANIGYAYYVNAARSVYKIIAMNTVESERLNQLSSYTHPFKSCDMRARLNSDGSYSLLTNGYCNAVYSGTFGSSDVSHCFYTNSRFQKSYALWGGFADETDPLRKDRYTEAVICR